ncbi:kinase-like domain-containing protein [Mycena sanguinolenta]|nr:kinase-like domain-containing protein [Mycena sanguinolenta]
MSRSSFEVESLKSELRVPSSELRVRSARIRSKQALPAWWVGGGDSGACVGMRELSFFSGLKSVHIEWFFGLDLDDRTLEHLTTSWTQLTELQLFEIGTDIVTNLTLKSLLAVARNCPHLRTFHLKVDASEVPELPPVEPQRLLKVLTVGESRIQGAAKVARYLSGIFPNVEYIRADSHMGRWKQVLKLLPEFVALRKEVAEQVESRMLGAVTRLEITVRIPDDWRRGRASHWGIAKAKTGKGKASGGILKLECVCRGEEERVVKHRASNCIHIHELENENEGKPPQVACGERFVSCGVREEGIQVQKGKLVAGKRVEIQPGLRWCGDTQRRGPAAPETAVVDRQLSVSVGSKLDQRLAFLHVGITGGCPLSPGSSLLCKVRLIMARLRSVIGAENPDNYKPQGLHPVHLGDSFAAGRYKVVHKLGYGLSSTIWLVHDANTRTYASLKIINASVSVTELAVLQHLEATFDEEEEGSNHIVRMFDHFVHEGPNGRHQCIVGEVLGPSLAADVSPFWDPEILPGDMVRRLAGQIAVGVSYLHKRGAAHGDLHPGNVLLCLPKTWASPSDVENDIGPPRKREFGATPSPHLPQYLVPGVNENIEFLRRCLAKPRVKLCDFSEGYIPSLLQPPGLASPRILRPPEALLGDLPHATTESDIWALAVLVHYLFTGGCGLFYDRDDRMLQDMVLNLGKFPEPFWSRWKNRNQFFDEHGRSLDASVSSRFLKLRVAMAMPEGGEEHVAFEALLKSMVRYDPQSRIPADQVIKSAWFQRYCRPRMGDQETFVVELCDW